MCGGGGGDGVPDPGEASRHHQRAGGEHEAAEADGEGVGGGSGQEAADGERDGEHAGLHRGVALAALQPDREDQEEALHADGEEQLDGEADGEGGESEGAGGQQRYGRPAPAGFEYAEADDGEDPGGQAQPAPQRPAVRLALDERQHDGDQGAGEDEAAGQVGAAGAALAGGGDQDGSGHAGGQGDRHVDEEDGPPAPAEQVGVGEQAAEQQPDGGGEAGDGPVHPEDGAAFLALEQGAEGAEHLGHQQGGHDALHGAGGDQLAGALGEAEIQPVFDDWAREVAELCDEFTTAELETVIRFLQGSNARQLRAATRLSES